MKEIVNDGFAKVVKPYMDAQDKKSREIIAPVEVSPAEAAHSAGDQIIFNGILYDVIAPIAINDALSTSGAGANISAADNIEAQIKATKSQIQTAAAQAAAQNKNTQEMIAPVEEDETDASRAYAIGDQLILDGVLYNVIDAIAQHGIITSEGAGANIEEADNVTDQLSSLNGALTNEIDKAYKTDDAAITEVASDDLLPIYDTSAAAKKKIAVNNFIGGLVSNSNLLDNPWFTVNQRGQSTYTGSNAHYTVDRWRANGGLNVTVNNDKTITVENATSADTWILQVVDKDSVFQGINAGETVTVSVMMANGNIHKVTGVIPTSEATNDYTVDQDNIAKIRLQLTGSGAPQVVIYIKANSSATIKAIKLERGAISTLAMDTAPNYATELLKCQRYFYRIDVPQYQQAGIGVAQTTSSLTVTFFTPANMRIKPSVTSNGAIRLRRGSNYIAVESMITYGTGNYNRFSLQFTTAQDALTEGELYAPYASSGASYLDFSADF